MLRRTPTPLPDISNLTDGSEALITAHVIKTGTSCNDGFGTTGQMVDVETEQEGDRGEDFQSQVPFAPLALPPVPRGI
jgi:hypothetical protein